MWVFSRFCPNQSAFTRIFALLVVLAATDQAYGALQFDLTGVNDSTNDTATVTIDYQADSVNPNTSGTLTITVDNTSSVTSYLSGFGFNLPALPASVTSINGGTSGNTEAYGPDGWVTLLSPGNINLPSANDIFDVGVKDKDTGNWINGGVGAFPGVLNGTSQTFTLTVVGTGLGSLTASSFLTSSTENSNQYFGIRDQGIAGGVGSDELYATGAPTVATPEPATVVMALTGLLPLGALALRRRRRRSRAA